METREVQPAIRAGDAASQQNILDLRRGGSGGETLVQAPAITAGDAASQQNTLDLQQLTTEWQPSRDDGLCPFPFTLSHTFCTVSEGAAVTR